MKKLKFRHKIGNILHFIRLLETRNHDVSAQTPGVNGQKLLFFCKIPGVNSRSLKTIFQHKACTVKLYADSFYKVQKNSHSSFEVICCRS